MLAVSEPPKVSYREVSPTSQGGIQRITSAAVIGNRFDVNTDIKNMHSYEKYAPLIRSEPDFDVAQCSKFRGAGNVKPPRL